jgi:hypothetical protein
VVAAALSVAAVAQNDNGAVVISPSFAVEGRVVKGVPYSAQVITSVKQTLPTGSEISTQMSALVARDSEGRTRREQTIRAIGPWAITTEPRRDSPTVIVIQDPVKLVTYLLDPQTHLARMTRQRSPQEIETTRAQEAARRPEPSRPEPSRPEGWRRERTQEKTELLGVQTVEGIKTEGKRTITILPVSSVGNTAPIEIVVETWYSPELQVVVRGHRSDPRVGDMTYRLTAIKRTEPPASLFEVPTDYRVEPERERRE